MTDSTVSNSILSTVSIGARAVANTLVSSGGSARSGGGDLPFMTFSLQGDITISQFPTPLPDPLSRYRPSYTTLPDGSLLTAVYRADLFSANSRLFGVGALLTLGAVNVWTCVSYIRRGKVKDKTLFYLLLASQILLPTCFGALLAPFFLETVDCTIVNTIAVIATELSYAILITGILGLKAYRCLSRSRFILVVVWVLQLSIFALFALDIRGINSPRRISGSCGTDGNIKFTPIALVLTVGETFFLALCFLYAVWKSTLYPAAQGRLSIALSEKAPIDDPRDDIVRRGWWDYVPRAPASEVGSVRHQRASGTALGHGGGEATRPSADDSLVKRLRNSVMRLTTSVDLQHQPLEPLEPQTFTRKPSIPTEYPLSQPPRPRHQPQQSQATSERGFKSARQSGMSMRARSSEVPPSARATSVKSINFAPQPTSQRSSRIDPLQPAPPRGDQDDQIGIESVPGKRLPAVLQVRAVIKDEMVYTTVIMLSCILAAVLSFWRARENDVVFGPSIWLGANWAAISLLVMRTFSKVVQRHEREAILQSPSAYGGPLLSRNDFGPNVAAITIARRRRDALALARNASSVPSPQAQPARRRKIARRSSWDYANSPNYSPSVFEDNASMRRREGLRAWDQEKELERQRREMGDENPFADFNEIYKVDVFDGEAGDIGRRKSGEGPFGAEEMMLDSESIHRELILQKPMVASPWNDNPFTYVDFGGSTAVQSSGRTSGDDHGPWNSGRKRSLSVQRSISPFGTPAESGRRGSATSRSSHEDRDRTRYLQPFSQMTSVNAGPSASLGRAGPVPAAGMRRGAIASMESYAPPPTMTAITPSPSPPQSRNGSSIELLEQISRTKD